MGSSRKYIRYADAADPRVELAKAITEHGASHAITLIPESLWRLLGSGESPSDQMTHQQLLNKLRLTKGTSNELITAHHSRMSPFISGAVRT